MPKDSAVTCPACGSADAKPISTSDCYLNNPPVPGERPIATVTVYLCSCGELFDRLVKHSQVPTD